MSSRILRARLRDGAVVQKNTLHPQAAGALPPGHPDGEGPELFLDCVVFDIFLHPAEPAKPAGRRPRYDDNGDPLLENGVHVLGAEIEDAEPEVREHLEIISLPHIYIPIVGVDAAGAPQKWVFCPPWKEIKRDAFKKEVRDEHGDVETVGPAGVFEASARGIRTIIYLDPTLLLADVISVEPVDVLLQYVLERRGETAEEPEPEPANGKTIVPSAALPGATQTTVVPS